MLKISTSTSCNELLEPSDYFKIGLLVQDTVYQVREKIVLKLGSLVSSLPTKFAILFALAAHEPERELLNKAKSFMTTVASSKRQKLASYFVDFLHLLAHHPDFTLENEDVALFDPYIQFYLECVANSESVSYLYSQAGELKTIKDKLSDDSIPLYLISELAQMRIQEMSVAKNWALQSYQAKIKLPKDLFDVLSQDKRMETLKTVYLETKTDYLSTIESKKSNLNKQRGMKFDEEEKENIKKSKVETNKVGHVSPVRRSVRQRKISS